MRLPLHHHSAEQTQTNEDTQDGDMQRQHSERLESDSKHLLYVPLS